VVVTYVTSSELRNDDKRQALLENTLGDFSAYGFEAGRRWLVESPLWAHLVLEFRLPEAGPASEPEYMGRTIARTMHWKGAEWLLRAEREREEAGAMMLEALEVQPGWTVTDFGCGNGYYTLKLAQQVGPEGRVFGVDIQQEMLDMLEQRAEEAGVKNIEPILGAALDVALPADSCDLVLLADVYHEMSHPVPMLAVIRRSLKPGGRVALLEFRAEDPKVPIKRLHKMSRQQILSEMHANGFVAAGSFENLPRQHLLFFGVADRN
jgi:ubiquinone/menaquinone biosynthesis C-methylase UbiE